MQQVHRVFIDGNGIGITCSGARHPCRAFFYFPPDSHSVATTSGSDFFYQGGKILAGGVESTGASLATDATAGRQGEVKTTARAVLIIVIALGIPAVGMLFYLKHLTTPSDKTGMVYKNPKQTSDQINPEEQNINDK